MKTRFLLCSMLESVHDCCWPAGVFRHGKVTVDPFLKVPASHESISPLRKLALIVWSLRTGELRKSPQGDPGSGRP